MTRGERGLARADDQQRLMATHATPFHPLRHRALWPQARHGADTMPDAASGPVVRFSPRPAGSKRSIAFVSRSSTRRVEAPPIQASWMMAISVFAVLLRGSVKGENWLPCHRFGVGSCRCPAAYPASAHEGRCDGSSARQRARAARRRSATPHRAPSASAASPPQRCAGSRRCDRGRRHSSPAAWPVAVSPRSSGPRSVRGGSFATPSQPYTGAGPALPGTIADATSGPAADYAPPHNVSTLLPRVSRAGLDGRPRARRASEYRFRKGGTLVWSEFGRTNSEVPRSIGASAAGISR